MEQIKRCSECLRFLGENSFAFNNKKKGQRMAMCKKCNSRRMILWQKIHRKRATKNVQEYRQRLSSEECVYFIEAENGLIKIGRSTMVGLRLRYIQSCSPIPLTLLKTVQPKTITATRLESDLHKSFARLCSLGEWFHPDTNLLKHLEQL